MDQSKLAELLESVANGTTSPDEAAERLRTLPFEDLGFAKLDHHRHLRQGYPETVYAEGKTCAQVVEIVQRMRDHGSNVLVTRCSQEVIEAVLAAHPDAVHHVDARAITIVVTPPESLAGYIAVVCAGTSDIPIAEEAAVTAESMGNEVRRLYDVGIAGLHRILSKREEINGANVIICCAGMEGALASVTAGLVDKPIIGVPTSVGYGASFGGVAALLTMLNSCASGVTVVNIDNGFGAGVNATIINRLLNGSSS
jgi:NCAIR mutase (PurE)-related protein